jgi:hypothetical protein
MKMADYKVLVDKDIPVIIDSAPNTIQVINGLACKLILDKLGKLGPEEKLWRKLFFIEPNRIFKSIKDVLPEQVCFIILFTQLFFTAVVSNPEIKTTQSSSFRKKYNEVNTLLNKPLAHINEFVKLWNTLQTEYINKRDRAIPFSIIKSFIISGPDMITQYFDEAIRIHNGEIITKRFFSEAPQGSASIGPGNRDR